MANKSPKYLLFDFSRWLNKFVTLDTAQTVTGQKKFGDTDNYTTFESDGTIFMGGNATVWRDINIGGASLGKGATAPNDINLDTTTILVPAFDGNATTESLSGAFELQHDYKEGTDITPHVHWYPTTATTADVKWQLEYYIRDGNTLKLTATTSVTTSTGGVAWQEIRSSFPAITGTNLKIGAQVHFRLFRNPTDVADTYTADAALATVGIHYQIDTLGSRQITTK